MLHAAKLPWRGVHYIVYDLEATCWPNRPPGVRQEIIEVGAFKLTGGGEAVQSFQAFVRPVVHPMLSPFCQELTGISQPQVNAADRWPEVAEDFLEFVGYYDEEDYLLCSWGDWDAKQLRRDCRLHDLDEDWVAPAIDLKRQYQRIHRLKKPRGLAKSLRVEGYEWEGEPHRAIDDARNTVKLFLAHLDEWAH